MSAPLDLGPDQGPKLVVVPPGLITGHVFTPRGARYMTQLAKHWAHRFEVELTATTAMIPLPFGPVRIEAEPDALVITLEPNPDADVATMKDVVERHLDRFAFREGGLTYLWTA
jgi:hypothetical protein